MPLQELPEDPLALGSGPDGVLQFLETAKVTGPALERDLGGPAAGSLVAIDAAYPAGVVGEQLPAPYAFQAGTLHEVPGAYGVYPAAAAFGMAALEVGLACPGLLSAVAKAAPVVLPAFPAIVGHHCQAAKTLSDPVLWSASRAFCHYTAGGIAARDSRTGVLPAAGYRRTALLGSRPTSAVLRPPVLQVAGGNQYLFAAAAGTAPYGIAVPALLRGLCHGQHPEPPPAQILKLSSHGSLSFPYALCL